MGSREYSAGPRWLDADRAASVSARTLKAYRRSALCFIEFCEEKGWFPNGPEEWDDLMIEYSFTEVTPSRMRELYAAVEFFFPRFRNKLIWCKSRIDVMMGLHPPRHTVPAGMEIS